MGRKPELFVEIKVGICERYLNGESCCILADIQNIHERTAQRWTNIYRSQGASCFNSSPHNAKYTKEFKQQVVEAYLAGEGSIDNLCRSITQMMVHLSLKHRHNHRPEQIFESVIHIFGGFWLIGIQDGLCECCFFGGLFSFLPFPFFLFSFQDNMK